MATFQISITNDTFASSNSQEVHSLDAATAQALKAALQIGSDEVVGGKRFFAAEVKVETANETVRRFVVSMERHRSQFPNSRVLALSSWAEMGAFRVCR